ncbi:SulP family inorganic anion transporter [Planctomicrobium sp. SH661]|uniref:SulP family inorganic anion transporter n=1 Tax=Planctomicrobium sp. SH661 TaxID=3448124 RepID=UPI003F5BE453
MQDDQQKRGLSPKMSQTWQQDFLASIVVFLVALPLCMGIAIASGAPASAGLMGGIIGGLVVGALSGCPLQVSGPAAGLTTVMFDAIHRHGLDKLGLIVMIAGIIQLVGGWLRVGQWFRAVSPAVIRGMLGGIGVLILASQFHVMLDDVPHGSGIRDLITIPQAIQKAAHIPQLSSRDLRHDSRMVLQDLGELHRQQVNLNEQVAEEVPHHLNRPEEKTGILVQFVPEQEEIRAGLEGILTRSKELFHGNEDKLAKIQEFGSRAIASQQLSLKDLQEEQWSFIVPAQVEAEQSLAALQTVFKNHDLAAAVGVLSIVVLLLWVKIARGPLKVIPAPLMAVTFATLAAALWQLPILYVEVPDSLWEEMHLLHFSSLFDVEWQGILVTAVTIAVLASAQTLLTATAVDQLHHGERTNYDKELFAQGVGNCLCGFVGALPLAAVIVRSTANIEAGGKTRLSAMLHGLWMLLIVALLGTWLRMIPTSALAAILVYTGYKLVDWKAVKQFSEYGYGEVLVYLVTLVTVVSVDLLVGVVAGFVCALVLLAYRFSRLRIRLEGPDDVDQYVVRLEGAATFLKLPKLAATLEKLPPGRTIELNVSRLHYIDQACLESLRSWAGQYEAGGGDVVTNWAQLEAWAHGGQGVSQRDRSSVLKVAEPSEASEVAAG